MPRIRPVLGMILGTLLCVSSILTPRLSIADDVPTTALSTSLSIPSEVLDHPSLLFRYPQRAPLLESQGFAFVPTSSRPAIGGIVRSGKLGGFVVVQRLGDPPSTFLDWDPILFQAGVGIQSGWLRAGAAIRAASLTRDGATWDPGDPTPENDAHSKTNRLIEPAFGVGLDPGDHRIDLELSLSDLTDRYRSSYQDEERRLTVVSNPVPRVAARIDLAVGKESRAILTSSYAWGDLEWEAQATRQGLNSTADERIWRDDWSSSIAWITRTGALDWLAIHGNYRAWRDGRAILSNNRLELNQGTDRTGTIGLSARHSIYRRLELLAGVSGSYRLVREETTSQQMDTALTRRHTNEQETASDRFSWGASYAWKGVRLAGAMNTALGLDQLFYSIDMQIAPR